MFRFKKASSSFLLVFKNSTISLCLRQFVNLSSQNSPISISTISLNFKKSSHSIWKLLQLFHHLRRNITFHLEVFLYMYIYNGVFCPHIDQLIHPRYLGKGSLSSPNVNSMFICQKDTKSGAEEVLQQNRIPLKKLLNAVYVSAVSLAVGLHWVTRHFPLSSINWFLKHVLHLQSTTNLFNFGLIVC